jgi:hypothetical protein
MASVLRSQTGFLVSSLHKQPFAATQAVFNQLPRASVLGIRAYATQQQGKQILLRDHGVFGEK